MRRTELGLVPALGKRSRNLTTLHAAEYAPPHREVADYRGGALLSQTANLPSAPTAPLFRQSGDH